MARSLRVANASFDSRLGVTDGARTRDPQYHKLMLYQLSYGHHGEQ